ncbi:MAG: response regulator [Scytonematopsis contorta HA4267-MV1]|jgi:DNA-binding response OmpR family regulator/HPt (histidine-containing phosphotransfer) domain-containing protein|nr:response regulator [Scytonematopsis contorta HA4267-MV1]
MKILLVEDDQPTGSVLAETLKDHRYNVNMATDGLQGLELAKAFEYDLILLDIIIPKLDGITLCKSLREYGYKNPILLLTAKDSSSDRVIGLDAGADDYVVKPFDLQELLARIRALLRRSKSVLSTVMTWENIQLDPINTEITCNSQRLHFTAKEYCLLELFLLNPKRVFSRKAILDKLWDFAESPGEETVSTHIKCLRQKLKVAGASDPVETVYGLGYRLRQEGNISKPLSSEDKSFETRALNPTLQQKKSKIWEKYKDELLTRAVLIQQTAEKLAANKLTNELREEAKNEAHKLAGSLGIFGLDIGSNLAQELERLLHSNVVLESLQIQQVVELANLLVQEFDKRPNPPTPFPIREGGVREGGVREGGVREGGVREGGVRGREIGRDIQSFSFPLHVGEGLGERSIYTPLILVVDDDLLLAEQIRIEGIDWGMRVEVATDLIVARQMIVQTPPDVILLDLNFPNSQEDGLTLLRELENRTPKIPVIAFTGRESLADRVEVAQLGGYAFLHKPLAIEEILKAVKNTFNSLRSKLGNRVMLVDDDSVLLENVSNQMTSWGIEIITLSKPKQFWEVLTSFHPNLLVLDMEMPDFDGIQLCQAVRTDPYWQHLTIMFLSAHTSAAKISRAFEVGADSYINKSTDGEEIARLIIRRLRK